MVKIYISGEKYVAKILFSVVVLLISGFIFGPSIYFQFSRTIDVALAVDVGYGGGTIIYCPTIPGKIATATLSSVNQSIKLGESVSFVINTSNFDNPSYSIVDSFPGTSVTVNNLSSNVFTWTPTKNDVGVHDLSISVNNPCNNINLFTQITVLSPRPFVPKFPNTGLKKMFDELLNHEL